MGSATRRVGEPGIDEGGWGRRGAFIPALCGEVCQGGLTRIYLRGGRLSVALLHIHCATHSEVDCSMSLDYAFTTGIIIL